MRRISLLAVALLSLSTLGYTRGQGFAWEITQLNDVDSTDDFPCYVVSKYVEGSDLSTKLKQSRLTYSEAAKLVAAVADALHYAHTHGVIHQNVKPSNILTTPRLGTHSKGD